MHHLNDLSDEFRGPIGVPVPTRTSARDHAGLTNPISPDVNESSSSSFATVFVARSVWMLGTVLVFFLAWILGPRLVEHYHYAATKAKIQAEYDVATVALKDDPLSGLSTAYQMVARRIRPSVVHIATISPAEPSELPMRGRRQMGIFPSEGQGSGVIVSKDGYILTNEHVIRDAESIEVVLSDRRTYQARLVGVDVHTDLAVIQIDADDLIPAEWGASDSLDVGSMIWAVGSPFGLEQSITFGIVSAKHRKTNQNPNQDLLQTDAAVNPGNSGGPLVNAQGQVVGINTSIVGESYQGISFAVPSDLARPIYERIVKHGEVERGFLGVYPTLVTPEHARINGLPDLNGALIARIETGSPAHRGGLREGDVITSWNDVDIKNDILLFRHVGLTPVNSQANVTYWRNGEEHTTSVTVARKVDLQSE